MKNWNNLLLCGLLLSTVALLAQDGPRGHWTGTIEIPDHPLAVEVDLDKNGDGWIGSISIPDQNASGIPLEAISFAGGKCTFRIKGAPGEPTFTSTLSSDGKTMPGEFTQASNSFPLKLTRTGDAKVEEIGKSPALAKEFLGTWEGTLEAGQSLRLILKMANGENGANATLISVDQGGVEIPVASIDQKDTKLMLVVKAVGGEYKGEINKDATELNGTWSQAGNDLPLKLTKKTADAPKP